MIKELPLLCILHANVSIKVNCCLISKWNQYLWLRCSLFEYCWYTFIYLHFQKPKSYTAAEATLNINPYLKIDSYINKVCPATENTYSDEFYTKQDVIVTALDNVEARRYIDR